MSVRALAWLGGIDSFGRGETTRPALQHEGLFTGHAPDSGQQPHRPPAHGASMIVVAEAHGGSSCGEARGPHVHGAMLRDNPQVGKAALSREAAGCRYSWGLDRTPTRTSWGLSNEKAAEIAAAAMVAEASPDAPGPRRRSNCAIECVPVSCAGARRGPGTADLRARCRLIARPCWGWPFVNPHGRIDADAPDQ